MSIRNTLITIIASLTICLACAKDSFARQQHDLLSTTFTGMIMKAEDLHGLKHMEALVTVMKKYTKTGKSAHVEGAILIKASPEHIWSILVDCKRGPTFMPGLKKCEMLEISPDKTWDIRRHTNKVSAFTPKTISEFKNEYNYPVHISFARTGGDLKALSGMWHLYTNQEKNQTILTYQSDITVKTALPDSILRKSIRKRVAKVLKLICIEVENDQEAQRG